jgi:EAL domain-containing protein (putative c-di-GMP-specific phosphodiesterase class I)
MTAPANLAEAHVRESAAASRRIEYAALRRILSEGGPQVVYQPQLSLSRLVVDGYEALARFPETPLRGTETWFARARELGVGDEFEAAAVLRALAHRNELPIGTTLAVNLSPGVLTSPAVAEALPDDLTGIEIELTEHEWRPGAGRLRRRLETLRERGARLAIDDVGTAHSGLRRVMDLAPDRIKLDRHLVQGVAGSTARAALIRAVVDFAEHIGASVCAEGVETLDDLETLAELDVGHAQGWMVGLPEAGFTEADPMAVAAGRDSLSSMLGGRSLARHDANGEVDRLLQQLTKVTGLRELADLVSGCVGVLGGDRLSIGVLTDDGRWVRTLTDDGVTDDGVTDEGATGDRVTDDRGDGASPPDQAPIERLALDDHPSIRRCLHTGTVVPFYLGGAGDPAAWQMLSRLGFTAGVLIPVISRGATIGLLQCYRSCPLPWTRRQIGSARTVASMLGPVLDLMLRE